MTLREFMRNVRDRFYTEPFPTWAKASAQELEEGVYRRLGVQPDRDYPPGANIYDLGDWDVCILLDAAHPAIVRQVSREYAWLNTDAMGTYTTVGGYSLDWLDSTFTDGYRDQMADTGLVAWNPYTEHSNRVSDARLDGLYPVHEWGWDDSLGCIPPDAVTDTAIDALDAHDRVIAWYQQPHAPYRTLVEEVETLTQDVIGNEDAGRLTVWNLLRRGEVTPTEAHIACADTLRWALEDIKRLLRALPADADVVLTADHGEVFGADGRWGHPKDRYHPQQLRVPRVPVDQSTVDKTVAYGGGREAASDTEQRLAALGYR